MFTNCRLPSFKAVSTIDEPYKYDRDKWARERNIYIYISPSLRSRSNLRFQEANILETGLRPDEIDTRISSKPGSKPSSKETLTSFSKPRLLALNSNFFFFVNFQIVSKDVRRSLSTIKDREGKRDGRERRGEERPLKARDMWDSWLNGDHRGGQFPVNDRLLSG